MALERTEVRQPGFPPKEWAGAGAGVLRQGPPAAASRPRGGPPRCQKSDENRLTIQTNKGNNMGKWGTTKWRKTQDNKEMSDRRLNDIEGDEKFLMKEL